MKSWTFRLFQGKISFQVSMKWLVSLLLLSFTLIALFLIALAAGSNWVPLHEVILQLTGHIDKHSFVIETLRLPRVILAILVGSSLGVAGLILQALVRNPLASPDIIGITSGASFGAVTFITLGTGLISMHFLPLAAIAGGLITALLIYIISWNKGVTPIRLVLIGIGISAILKAGISFMIVFSDTVVTTKAYIWLTGSLYAASWNDVLAMILWLLIPIPILLLLGRSMNVSELGDDTAVNAGIHLQLQRFVFLMCSVILAGTAAAYAGGIEFVGLMAPHIAKRLIARDFNRLIPLTALIGAILVLVADIVARTMFLPKDIPAGVFTAAIGAPFFIYLLFHNRNR